MMDARRWERVQALFHTVVELGPEQRTQALQRECAGDPALMTEVLRMLEADARSAGLLDAGLPQIADQMLPATPMGRRNISPWEIRHILGEGGMGTVFFAVRPDLGTSAAIKVLRDSWLSPARRERFAHEQYNLAQLDHPNIARLLDASTLEDGTPYFVMEYVEGLHLDEYCDVHGCGMRERLRLFRSVCEAVQFAHGRAIIHRDLKPSNVLVTSNASVKLLDFGVAKRLDEFGLVSDLTRTGLRMLTPAFAAPEQLRGEPAAMGADVYSLGVILYRLLTGRLPFDDLRRDLDLAALSLNRDVVRPSLVARRVQQKGNARVRGISRASWNDLDVICLKAMHNDAGQRYASAEALRRDIDHYLAGEPLEARPDTHWYRTRKFVRRHRIVVAATGLSLLAASVLIVLFMTRLSAERNAAIAEVARTQRIQHFMQNLFDGGDPDAGPSHDLRVAALLDKGVQEAAALDKDPDIQAELYQNLGNIYRKLGDLSRAEMLFNTALRKRRQLSGDSSAAIAETTAMLALLRVDQAKLDEAERLAREAVAISRGALPPEHPTIAIATEGLGRVLEEKGKYADSIPVLEEAVRLRSSPRTSGSDLAGALYELANAYFYAGKYKDAEAINHRVLKINREIYGAQHPRVAEVLVNLGAIQQDTGNYPEAEKYQREALGITRTFFGETHYRTAAGFTLVARSLVYQKKFDEAAPLLRDAIAVQERVFGRVHPRVASAVNELGTVALQKGDPEGAKKQFRRMLEIYKVVYPEGHYLIGTATSNLGSAFMASHDNVEAEKLFRRAIAVFARTLSVDHLNTAIARVKLGRTLLRQRRFAEAEAESSAGYNILRKQMNPSVTWLNSARADLVEIYGALGQTEKQSAIRLQLAQASNR
ncbi:MAG TPA: serine/threonine-protein kinase [Bryobacteraceae bacterium]|nr:serine/threonine-protein kinase [Bryobacteraceae bacterium]